MILNIVFASIVVVLSGILLSSKWGELREKRRSEQRQESELWRQAMTLVAKEMEQLGKGLTPQLAEGLTQIPSLIEGLKEMCQHSAAQVDSLNKAVDLLQASMSSTDSDRYEEFAEETPAAIRAQERQEIRDLQRRGGLSEEDATARVRERAIYSHLERSR